MAWYNFNDLRSHNAMLSFVLSARGGGKTYGAKVIGIKDWIKKGEQFVYLRRLDAELATRRQFFDDIIANEEFPEYEFKVVGYQGYIRKKVNEDFDEEPLEWSVLCHFIPLSISQKFKSTPFPLVTKIFFDEVIIDTTQGTQHYLKNEPIVLMEFLSTVIRKRSGVKFYGMANNISLVNPHFIYWNMSINPNKRFNKHPIKSVVVELWQSEEFANEMESTEFGTLISGTEYGAYAIENNALVDNNSFICKRPSTNLEYMLGFIIEGKSVYLWKDDKEDIIYIDDKSNGNTSTTYTITDIDHSPSYNSIFTIRKKPIVDLIKKYKHSNNIYYNNLTTQQLFTSILKYL